MWQILCFFKYLIKFPVDTPKRRSVSDGRTYRPTDRPTDGPYRQSELYKQRCCLKSEREKFREQIGGNVATGEQSFAYYANLLNEVLEYFSEKKNFFKRSQNIKKNVPFCWGTLKGYV